jgi:hypothetical protein
MGTLLSIMDFVVLLFLIVQVLREVGRQQIPGSGSLVLSVCLAFFLLILGTVSFTAYLGLVEVSSSLTRGIFLVILLAMAALLSAAWTSKQTAS